MREKYSRAMVILLILIASFALVAGALWGAWIGLSERVEGFIIAMAGGALIVAVMDDLIRPSVEVLPLWAVLAAVGVGAAVFTGLDTLSEMRLGATGGMGLLLAVTIDGIPENLALGTALIGTDAAGVAALAGAIFLSNLPEAAGGARRMVASGWSRRRVLTLWVGVAALLSLAAFVGFEGLGNAGPEPLFTIKSFAAGAVAASLATEVFPKAFLEDRQWTGIAVALGLMLALALSSLA